MGRLYVEVQWPRHRVVTAGNTIESGCHAVNDRSVHLVTVLLEKAVAENTYRIGIRSQFLDNQVIVLARLDVSAVFAHRIGNRVEQLLALGRLAILFQQRLVDPRRQSQRRHGGLDFNCLIGGQAAQRLQRRDLRGAAAHGQLRECIAGTGGRRRPQHLYFGRGQDRVYLVPGLVGVRYQFAVGTGDILGQREIDIFQAELERGRLHGIGQRNTVVPYEHLHDVGDAICLAVVVLALLDPAR